MTTGIGVFMQFLTFGLVLLSTIFGVLLSLLWRQADLLSKADKEQRDDLKELSRIVSDLAEKVSTNKTETVATYVTKEELNHTLEAINQSIEKLLSKWSDTLTRIYDKLEGKADKATRVRSAPAAKK